MVLRRCSGLVARVPAFRSPVRVRISARRLPTVRPKGTPRMLKSRAGSPVNFTHKQQLSPVFFYSNLAGIQHPSQEQLFTTVGTLNMNIPWE